MSHLNHDRLCGQTVILEAIARWLEIRQRHGRPGLTAPETIEQLIQTFRADAWHSALLQRLLHGEEPLPEPPPRYCSYPWYAVVETDGPAACMAEGTTPNHYDGRCIDAAMGDHVHIGQTPWLVADRVSTTELLVRYREGGPVYRLSLEAGGHPVFGWSITREAA